MVIASLLNITELQIALMAANRVYGYILAG